MVPSRRELLTLLGSATVVGLAGCANAGPDGDGTPESTPSPEPTDTPEPSETPEQTEAPEPTETPKSDAPLNDFYVENYDDENYCVDLCVGDPDDPLIEGAYEVRSERGVEFEEVARSGREIPVRVGFYGEDIEEFTWELDECPGTFSGRNERAAAVQITDGEFDIERNGCDAIAVGHGVPLGPAWDSEGCESEA